MLKTGIVGLPNVGKSTLFNALVENAKAQAANFPFCTIEPNTGIVNVPDERLAVLARIVSTRTIIPARIEYVDIAGLVRGASQGEGLGNQFLSHIRQVDAVVHVVRCFENADIVHVEGSVDPARDISTINLELALADLGQIEKRLQKIGKQKNSKEYAVEMGAIDKITPVLNDGRPARATDLSEAEKQSILHLDLLTFKPVIYAANVSESDLAAGGNAYTEQVAQIAAAENAQMVVLCAQLEAELAELDPQERTAFLADLGVTDSGLQKMIQATYSLLGLQTFFTAGEKEVRAWTISQGTTAPQAAGTIHTDFERGFIRAETVAYRDLVATGSTVAAREKGLLRSEGKEYVVKDGDVMHFRFNV
ncbi:redox-regulated ATPase YchF [Gloeobacter kilaueensis]|uniref:Ribosome-binding ATPase YchF n=1 Tax=Gloeobacter kilaueensis (strain ATCC BAA-2537 / CCAP 1431/1 / ULC 316 / JS1) TaxID=1183438 RepID=U5QKG6_GLOK1|nr:redox-regulated ATPase YchF [Gloeobacter kilaueensis]AGY59401.1 GTP-dependent nucleic acid-binding protein EngD [Gloeobacter kilaueensis JS1]